MKQALIDGDGRSDLDASGPELILPNAHYASAAAVLRSQPPHYRTPAIQMGFNFAESEP